MFRRSESVSLAHCTHVFSSRCAFCGFLAASNNEGVLEMAERAHNCLGIREYKARGEPPKKPPQSVGFRPLAGLKE
jgi:hypothetical protein